MVKNVRSQNTLRLNVYMYATFIETVSSMLSICVHGSPPKGKQTDVGRQICEKVALTRSAVLLVNLSERGSLA